MVRGIGKEHWTMERRDELGRNIGQWYDDGMASGQAVVAFAPWSNSPVWQDHADTRMLVES